MMIFLHLEDLLEVFFRGYERYFLYPFSFSSYSFPIYGMQGKMLDLR